MYLGIRFFISAYDAYQNLTLEPIHLESVNSDAKEKILISSNPYNKVSNENFFLKGLLLSITNPKGILFFLSFFIQFVDPSYPNPFISFLVLAIILQIISLCYQSMMVLAGERLSTRFRQYPWLVVSSMGLIGVLFIGFAISLWLAELN